MVGSTFKLTAKRNYTDADSAAVLQVSATPIAPDYLTALLTVPHAKSALLSQRSYLYNIQWTDGSGNITTLLKGKLNVEDDVTQATS